MQIDVGDLIIYKPFDNRMGVVIEESRGYVTIQWGDGRKDIVYSQSVIKDSCHTIVKA